jgi:hypothetical protein
VDLFDLANQNAPYLAAEFDKAKSARQGKTAESMEAFAAKVSEAGRVSLNLRPSTLAELVNGGEYRNTHQICQEVADLSGKSLDQALRDRLGKYYNRRMAFDAQFDGGSGFYYGALNIGGAGCVKFGVFCLILKKEFALEGKRVAYLKEDSLNRYVDPSGHVDLKALKHDVAPSSHRHNLAGLKHADQLTTTEQSRWTGLLCCDDQFIEAIFTERVAGNSFGEVRVQAREYDKLFRLAFDACGRKLSDGEYALVQSFEVILRAKKNDKLKLERVENEH